jgi:uncharacterized protein
MAKAGRHSQPQPQFEWDEGNEEKLLMRHNISAMEAEQCFGNRHTTRKGANDAYLLLGRTDEGRMLFLVYEQKSEGVIRVYSGREMTTRERRAYRSQVQ